MYGEREKDVRIINSKRMGKSWEKTVALVIKGGGEGNHPFLEKSSLAGGY
jgi:hypothetical protein